MGKGKERGERRKEKGEIGKGGIERYTQSPLYTCVKMSLWNP